MKKRFFSSCLMLLFILMISGCAGAYNDYKEKNTGSVSLNVGQIAQSVLQANRSISREGDEKDFIEPWQCISSAVLKINVETKGDYKTSETKELSFNYAKYMGFVEDYSNEPVTSDKPVEEENYLETTFKDEVIELKIPVGKTISIDMTVDQELSWDENKLEQFYNQLLTEMENSGASEEEIDKFTFASFKESLDLQFNGEMGIRLKGTSGEITVHEGENPVTITLKEVPYNGGEEIERKYYLIHLQSQNAATLTYEEPISFEYMSIDEDGARLKAICYYYEPVGYFINEEKSDQDWKEDDFGNLYMDIYFDYNEEAKKEGLYQTVGLDNIENRYTITLYSAKNQTDSGIYMIANSDGLQVSYGEWKDISGTDAKIPSFEFTENLYLNDLNGLSFAEDNTLTYSDMSDGFRFKSANEKEIDFGKLEPFNGEGNGGIEGTGTINPLLPNQFTIAIASAEETYYLNKGTIDFKLTDADGQEIDVSNVFWEYEISHGKTTIPDNGTYYTYENPGSLELKNLPASGTYQINVFVTPANQDYENYEMANAVFGIKFAMASYYEFEAGNLLNGYDISDNFSDLLDSINTDAVIKISGEVSESYGSIFQPIKNRLSGWINGEQQDDKVFQYLIDFDFSEMTTTSSSKNANSCDFQDCKQLRSIILPEDLTEIGYCTFMECSNLEKIVFGSGFSKITADGALGSCPKLTSVIIPETAPFTLIDSYTFASDTSLKTLSLPASFIALGSGALGYIENLILADESGTWYYTSGQNDWYQWESQNKIPPEVTGDSLHYGLLDELKDSNNQDISGFPVNGTVAEKLLFAAKNTEYYFYCVK